MTTRLVIAVTALLVAGCDQVGELMPCPEFSKTSHPQIAVAVTSDMFVTAKRPLLADVVGAYLIRLELSAAALGETRAIYEVCRAGGSAVVSVKGSSIPPFIVTTVTNDGEALVLRPTRERAVEVLHALAFKDEEFDGWKPGQWKPNE